MTQSSPMDFEKEAREILAPCNLSDGDFLYIVVASALRDAYTAGQKDMRERAEADCACDECTSIIRSLDILSPDHEKVG